MEPLTNVDEDEASVIVRPDDLTLIDLPEDAFFLAEVSKKFVLPILTIPIFILRQLKCTLHRYTGDIDVRV